MLDFPLMNWSVLILYANDRNEQQEGEEKSHILPVYIISVLVACLPNLYQFSNFWLTPHINYIACVLLPFPTLFFSSSSISFHWHGEHPADIRCKYSSSYLLFGFCTYSNEIGIWNFFPSFISTLLLCLTRPEPWDAFTYDCCRAVKTNYGLWSVLCIGIFRGRPLIYVGCC